MRVLAQNVREVEPLAALLYRGPLASNTEVTTLSGGALRAPNLEPRRPFQHPKPRALNPRLSTHNLKRSPSFNSRSQDVVSW